jgi:predicted PurR-regulated permease PerM
MATPRSTDLPLSRSVGCRVDAAIPAYRTDVADADPGAPDGPAGGPGQTRVYDLDWRTVAVFLASFVALAAVTSLFREAGRVVTWIVVGTLLALALDPLVTGLTRRVRRRSIAIAVVLAGFLAAVVLLVAVFGPPAARQAGKLGEELPQVIEDLGDLPVVGRQLRDADVSSKVEEFIDELPERLAGDTTPIENLGRSVLNGALAAVATLLVTVTLLLDGERFVGRIRRLVPPERRERADQIGSLGYRVVGQYFAGSVLVAIIAGIAVTTVGLILGVPLAPLAGAWVALFDLVPQIGGAVGGIPFVLLAFTQGPTVGLACLVFFVLYLQFENHVLSPLVVGRSVDLSPPATMTAALVGVSAAGVVGALVSVPLLGAAKAIYLELRPATTEPVVGDPDGEVVDT